MPAPFDPDRLEITGNAVPVLVGVDDNDAGFHYFAVSETGTLVYRPAPRNDRRLVLVDLEGRVEPLAAPPLEYQGVRFSPDGRQLVTTTSDGSVHLYELEQERFSLLFSSIEDPEGRSWTPIYYAVWAPDGTRVAVNARAPGTGLGIEIFIVSVSDLGVAEPLLSEPTQEVPIAWSPDGSRLVYQVQGLNTSNLDIWELSVEPRGAPRHVVAGIAPSLSPDGRWLAYESRQPGRTDGEIHVKLLDGAGRGRQVSVGGGSSPLWAPDGRTIYYRNGQAVLAVRITTEPTFSADTPRLLFETDSRIISGYDSYDLSPDGQRFVMKEQLQEPTYTELHVVQNWFQELKRLVPTDN